MANDLIEQLLDKELWVLRALGIAYYRNDTPEDEWDAADCIGEMAYAMNHASEKTGIALEQISHELSAPLLFVDSVALVHALGDEHHLNTPIPGVLLERVPENIQRFLLYFVDASYGSPTKP